MFENLSSDELKALALLTGTIGRFIPNSSLPDETRKSLLSICTAVTNNAMLKKYGQIGLEEIYRLAEVMNAEIVELNGELVLVTRFFYLYGNNPIKFHIKVLGQRTIVLEDYGEGYRRTKELCTRESYKLLAEKLGFNIHEGNYLNEISITIPHPFEKYSHIFLGKFIALTSYFFSKNELN